MRCVAGSTLPMNADRSDMMRCAEPSGYPTRHLLLVDGCGAIQRAYIDTTMNGGASGGVTRAAATVPIPLTANSSASVPPIGLTCLNHSTSTRSESFTTIGHRSYSFGNRPSYHREFQWCESQCRVGPIPIRPDTSGGGSRASCSRGDIGVHLKKLAPWLPLYIDIPAHHFGRQWTLPNDSRSL